MTFSVKLSNVFDKITLNRDVESIVDNVDYLFAFATKYVQIHEELGRGRDTSALYLHSKTPGICYCHRT